MSNPYWRAAKAAYTPRRVLVTQAVALTVAALMTIEWGYFGEFIHHTSIHYVTVSAYALVILPTAYCAEEAITRGAKPALVYSILLILVNPCIAVAVTGGMQWIYSLIFGFPWPARRWGFTTAAIEFAMFCSLGLLTFMNGRAAKRMLEGVRSAELRRVKLDQQLVESRLATAEAQIDPQMLFSALAQIKQGFETAEPDAEQKLNALIQKLRAALARTAAVTSEANDP